MHCANFPRHLGRLITRCLIARPGGADTIALAHWAYGEVLPRYARHNVRRLSFGIPRVGKRCDRLAPKRLYILEHSPKPVPRCRSAPDDQIHHILRALTIEGQQSVIHSADHLVG